MLHLLVALFALYLVGCYGWGVYVTVRLLRTSLRRRSVYAAEPGVPPLARIAPVGDERAQPKRKAA